MKLVTAYTSAQTLQVSGDSIAHFSCEHLLHYMATLSKKLDKY